jgi:hypothetical protein
MPSDVLKAPTITAGVVILPRNLKRLGWVNFQRRNTHSCLLKELDVDPIDCAEQMDHTVDINENVSRACRWPVAARR